jgi:hypothetical protein
MFGFSARAARRHPAGVSGLRPLQELGHFSPSRSVTYAFFQSGRWPANRPWRFTLPCAYRRAHVRPPWRRAAVSTARLISILLAPRATSNTIVRPSSRRIAVFSVMSGRE